MLLIRFGIFWSPIKYALKTTISIIMVACKLHNFIIESNEDNKYDSYETYEQNSVRGASVVYLQNDLHTEYELVRNIRRDRDNSELRDSIANDLHKMGYVKSRNPRSD